MLRIALPNKGRLSEDARELFADAGLAVRARGERALTASLGDRFEALFVRAQDIPEFVADGSADLGVTGWDLVRESGCELDPLLDLEFGRCRLVVAVRDEMEVNALGDLPAGVRVATPFPNLARGFFERERLAADVVPVSGAAEVAPHLGIADVVVDLASTGSTLRVNGLREIATVLESSAHLVARPDGGALAPEGPAGELVTALASVLRARGRRYVMANVPRGALDGVRRVLPGLNGPTVVDMGAIDRTIAGLKALGAEGILVTRIERLVP
jgi:ATP phosphoribosyltransferase